MLLLQSFDWFLYKVCFNVVSACRRNTSCRHGEPHWFDLILSENIISFGVTIEAIFTSISLLCFLLVPGPSFRGHWTDLCEEDNETRCRFLALFRYNSFKV